MVRINTPFIEDTGTNIIRLERFTKQALKAKLNENVEAMKISCNPVKRIILTPSIHVTTAHDLDEHIRETLVKNQTPVAIDSILYINFPHSTAGITYTIHELQSLRNCKFEFAQSLTEECFEKALEIILKNRVIIRKKEKLVKGAIK